MINIQEKEGGIILPVRVQPRAARDEVVGEYGDALKIRIAAPPVDGAANEACRKLLATLFGVKRSQVRILAGATAQNKTVWIGGVTKELARQKLSGPSCRG